MAFGYVRDVRQCIAPFGAMHCLRRFCLCKTLFCFAKLCFALQNLEAIDLKLRFKSINRLLTSPKAMLRLKHHPKVKATVIDWPQSKRYGQCIYTCSAKPLYNRRWCTGDNAKPTPKFCIASLKLVIFVI